MAKSRTERRSGATARQGRRPATHDSDSDLRTGSLAPADVGNAHASRQGIGAEVRRLRKSLDLTVAELGDRRRHFRRHAVEDRERCDLAVARDARRAGQGAQRADQPAVRRNRGAARLLLRQGGQRRAHRAARHQGRPPLRPARPLARRRHRRRALSHHAQGGRRALHQLPPCRRRVPLHVHRSSRVPRPAPSRRAVPAVE